MHDIMTEEGLRKTIAESVAMVDRVFANDLRIAEVREEAAAEWGGSEVQFDSDEEMEAWLERTRNHLQNIREGGHLPEDKDFDELVEPAISEQEAKLLAEPFDPSLFSHPGFEAAENEILNNGMTAIEAYYKAYWILTGGEDVFDEEIFPEQWDGLLSAMGLSGDDIAKAQDLYDDR